jgi:hypothetical protein
MSKNVPDCSIEDLCKGIKKTASVHFYYNFKNGEVKMLTAAEILDASDFIDLTPNLLANRIIEPFEIYANGFAINYNFDSADQYPSEDIKDITEYPRLSNINDSSLLPVANNWIDEVLMVYNENKFYLFSNISNVGQWRFYSENFQTEIIEDGKLKITSDLEPVLMINNPRRSTGTVEIGLIDSNMYVPKIKQKGNSKYFQQFNNSNGSRLMFWRGFEHTNYPFANYDIFDGNKVPRWNYSLKLTGEEGTINRFHEPFIRNLSQIKKKLTVQALFNKQQILDFKIWKYYRVESQNMLCKKMDVIFDNEKDCIRPAQLELLKK